MSLLAIDFPPEAVVDAERAPTGHSPLTGLQLPRMDAVVAHGKVVGGDGEALQRTNDGFFMAPSERTSRNETRA
jgi:hypothetical protein